MTTHAWILAILITAGCASTPATPEEKGREDRIAARDHEWRDVRVTANPDAVKGCKPLGNVSEDATNILGSGAENVQKGLKKKAAAMGGNVLFVISTETHRYSSGSGEVYACQAAPPTPTPK
jgi:hypothetical protein